MIRNLPNFDGALAALKRGYKTRIVPMSSSVALLLVLLIWNATASRRVWSPAEVVVAFWSWRMETPSQIDVNEAVRQTGAKTLFLRAGQIDIENGKLSRIRPVRGSIPTNIAVHLVYNATRSFLKDFEQIRVYDAGSTILAAFGDDLDRAHADHAQVAGVQLDFDIPTRLLPQYAAILRNLRAQMSKELQLSITGLPSWLDSPALVEPLSICDFWVPQCYGAQIPERLHQPVPITTPEHVARSVARTRDLGFPFYAGLAAYGYAIHYSRGGSLIGLRGDLDPLLVVVNADFELTDQRPFLLNANNTDEKKAGEWRCTYRARRDVIIDGTPIRAGESLLLDRPTEAGLRACASKVREQAGTRLLGICVFRIPTNADSTTLTLTEIVSALRDITPRFSLQARVDHLSVEHRERNVASVLELENNGATSSRTGEGALTVLVRVPAGRLESVLVDHSASAQTMFEYGDSTVRCDLKRANAVRLSVAWWPPGAKLTARFEIKDKAPNEVSLRYAATLDDGSATEGSRTLTMNGAR